jgi:hypothetical protein
VNRECYEKRARKVLSFFERMLSRLRLDSVRKSLLFAGVVFICLGITLNVFLFLISLPGGPGTQQSFDWFLIFTSFAPAYLPWKIPMVLYAVGIILIIGGLALRSKR